MRIALVWLCLALATSLSAQGRNLAGLATASARYPFMLGVDRPGRLLVDLQRAIDGYREDPHQVAVLAEIEEGFRKELSLSLFDPSTFASTGISLDRPMRVGLYDFGGWLGLPRTVLLEFGVSDQEKFTAWFGERFEDEEKAEGTKPEIWYSDKDQSAWTIIGKTCTAVFSSGEDSAESRLAEALEAKGRTMTIGAHPGYRRGAEYLGADSSAHLALYVHGEDPVSKRRLFDDLPIEALLFALGRRMGYLSIIPRADSAVLGQIRSGSKCAEFLGRLPKPLASMSLSVADPISLARAVTEEWFAGELTDLNEVTGMMEKMGGLSEAQLRAQLKDGSLAILLYPGKRQSEPRFLIVAHLNGSKSIRAKVARLIVNGSFPAEILTDTEQAFALRQAGEDACLVISGDYLVAGTALPEALTLTKTTENASTWVPQVGKGEIFEIDFGFSDMFAVFGVRLSKRLHEEISAAGRFCGVGKQVEDGFVVEFGFRSKTGRSQLGEWVHLWLVAMAEDDGKRMLKRQLSRCEGSLLSLAEHATSTWKQTGKIPALPLGDVPLRDPWGTAFKLKLDKTRGFVIAMSAGTDGRFGSGDDLQSK